MPLLATVDSKRAKTVLSISVQLELQDCTDHDVTRLDGQGLFGAQIGFVR